MDKGAQYETDAVPIDDGFTEFCLPNFSDFLLSHSSTPDFVSYRNADGSWYIQELCKQLNDFGCSQGLLENLTEVNQKIANMATRDKDKQMPHFVSMLSKEVCFRK